MKKVIVIVGPTASGKTGLSIKLAKAIKAEIINGDSVQIYEGLDIGSAKITMKEQAGIKHHLLSVASPKSNYHVYLFQQDARKLIDEIERPMIVGGTGLYVQAALYDYHFEQNGNTFVNEERYDGIDNETIYQELIKLDPDIIIDRNNRRRIIRAIEMAEQGDLRSNKKGKNKPLYDALIIYLDIDRQLLKERLVTRLKKQLEAGFLEETAGLRNKGIQPNIIGYRELNLYLDGIYTFAEAFDEIISVTMKLAKKQKTWFKNQMNPIILDALDPNLEKQALATINEFLMKG
ncbi:MAG: tRNA (adenosine(37)-N6)-dimethylallyltransferase MiaA [Acholeplasmataceae bacterium]